MKNVSFLVFVFFISALTPFSASCGKGGQSVESETDAVIAHVETAGMNNPDAAPAARINGSEIPMSELETAVLSVVLQNGMDASHTEAFMEQFGPRILDQLIQGEILYQEAVKSGFAADSQEIDSAFSGISGRYATPEEFQSEMEARDFTEMTIRENMAKQITIQKFIGGTIVPEAQVPEETVRAAYDQNPANFTHPEELKASHILIKLADSDPQEKKDDALKRARKIVSLAREGGADFALLAREHSEGPSAASGGDLGFFTKGRMVKPFEDAAFSLEVGKVSEPVLTQFGYHVIKIIERREGVTSSFEEVKEKLAADIKNRMIDEMVKRKIDKLKQASDIEIIFKPASSTPNS